MTRTFLTLVTAAVLTVGCSYISPPIRLDGRGAEVQALAGDWSGEYTSDSPDARHGSIWFKLVAGEDHAHGDVLMFPRGFTRPYERYRGEPIPAGVWGPPPAEGLSIRFVRVGEGVVSGMLESYWDPDRECQTNTVFRGRFAGRNTITGTFHSTYSKPLASTTGHWRVTRRGR